MKTQVTVLLLLYFLSNPVFSQDAEVSLEKGDRLFYKKQYAEALPHFLEGVELRPESAELNFRAGLTYIHLDEKVKALPYLQKAYEINPNLYADMDFDLATAYEASQNFARALFHYEEFSRKNKKLASIAAVHIHHCRMADSIMQLPSYAVIKNMEEVNSKFHDYSPIVPPNGSAVIFTSNRPDEMFEVKNGADFEDIYIAENRGGKIRKPRKISENINTKYHDAAASLSSDGKTLYLYYEEGTGDIYTSQLNDTAWSKPLPLNRFINTSLFWETSASISADGKKLFFTSNRIGGKGDLDIYVSELDGNGEWGKAYNLGSVINTPGTEDSPFLHPDGVTLYFSSNGHQGLGNNDIFKTTWVQGKWTKPVNLGYPVNSAEYDGFFTITKDKKTGYLSSLRPGGKGEADIYMVEFQEPPSEAKLETIFASNAPAIAHNSETEQDSTGIFIDPMIELQRSLEVVTILKGKVLDEKTGEPLNATITLVDNERNQPITRLTSNEQTGEFELVVPHGGNYGVATERNGYLFNSINFNVPQFAEYQEIDMSIILVKAEAGSKAILKNVFFDVGKSVVKKESISELDKMFQLLSENPLLQVQINGHTDNTGNAVTNKVLSLQRAEAVVKYLLEKGIDASRLQAKGYGSEKPIVSNDDETEGREINRRTEIEIISVK